MAISINIPVHEARANHSQPLRDVIHSTKVRDESADRTVRPRCVSNASVPQRQVSAEH